MFVMEDWEQQLTDQGIAVDRTQLQLQWDADVSLFFKQCDITKTSSEIRIRGGREGIHTEHLGHLLSEMQYLQRCYPGLTW